MTMFHKQYPPLILCLLINIPLVTIANHKGNAMKSSQPSSSLVNIGINEKNRSAVANILNKLLADEYVVYTKTLNYHWNIKGVHFGALHTFFGNQYEELLHIVDNVAERVQQVGHRALGSLQEFLTHTRIKENSDFTPTEKETLRDLLESHEAIIRTIRVDRAVCSEKYDDIGTDNFLTELLNKHEKMAWMLRSHLETI